MKRNGVRMLLALLLLAALAGGCASAPTASEAPKDPAPAAPAQAPAEAAPRQSSYPITVKDAAGREITFAAEPKRIISLVPSNTELVFALGKGSSLVGRSDFCDYPAEAKQIESIGGLPLNFEKIVSLQPDLILIYNGSVEERNRLEKEHKLTTFVVDPGNFAELYTGIQGLGQILNAQEAAEKLVAEMQAGTRAVEEKVAEATSKPVVFYEVWHDPLQTTGPNTFMDDMIRLAGGTNAAAAAKDRWAMFSLEQLAAANPDIILAGNPAAAKAILERKGWEGIKAVKDGKVFGAPDQNLVVRPGPRLIQGLNWMAAQIHPELFAQ